MLASVDQKMVHASKRGPNCGPRFLAWTKLVHALKRGPKWSTQGSVDLVHTWINSENLLFEKRYSDLTKAKLLREENKVT